MSHIFQRPVCDLGRAYDYAYRPSLGEPNIDAAGGCDDRPAAIDLFSGNADLRSSNPSWSTFSVCPGHQGELLRYDRLLTDQGLPSRLKSPAPPRP